ncbi:hypothetical protein ACIPJS_31025 [Streptomyces sp. NPDC086783]|uniref:hypothetical protein n=1 Tax=Streptomyces sp. NPDC086783 TaxID=3365758 RepID=UPI0038274DA0
MSVLEVMQSAPEVLSGIIRGGIPAGYLDDLRESLDDLWKLYGLADREGLCVTPGVRGLRGGAGQARPNTGRARPNTGQAAPAPGR